VCPVELDDGVECSLLAGECALYVEGDMQTAGKWFEAAYRDAERQRDGRGMARAALGLGGLWVHGHRAAVDTAMVRVRLRDALSLVDPQSSLALRLRVRLAAEDDFPAGEHAAILAMVAKAQRADDPVALAEALTLAHHCALGPEYGALRRELAQELIGVASKTNRRSDLLVGLLWYTVDLFLAADPRAERSLEELRGLLAQEDHLVVGYVVGALEVMLTVRRGRFDQAEALAAANAQRGAAAGDPSATGWRAAQIGTIRGFQGRIAELLPMLSGIVNSPHLTVLDNAGYAGLALAAASAGDQRLAAGALARLRDRVLADAPHTASWLMSMCCVVDVAHLLADAQTAADAYELLSPHAELPAMLGLGAVCLGSVHRHLGVACLTTGDIDRAIHHLSIAVHDNLALGHWPALALSRARLGAALALRDGPRDEAARRELALAEQDAVALGITLPDDLRPGLAVPAGGTGAGAEPPPVVVCRRRGRQWEIEWGGRTALIDNCVGVRHLATLLANPGYEILATELAAGPAPPETPMENAAVTSVQPVLDDLAKREYKQRLSQLNGEIDELEALNEFDGADAVRTERNWLVAELAAAVGMGGRPRQFTGSEERARIAVGKAIRRAMQRIAAADPVIGDELRATVQTGRHCCYRPR
jgi:hypothetical protein